MSKTRELGSTLTESEQLSELTEEEVRICLSVCLSVCLSFESEQVSELTEEELRICLSVCPSVCLSSYHKPIKNKFYASSDTLNVLSTLYFINFSFCHNFFSNNKGGK